jgi:hypothetical protein
MTTYSYSITMNDSEVIMLKSALKLMIKHCQDKIDKEEGAPYWVHRKSAQRVLERLRDNCIQTSGNNFNGDGDFLTDDIE